MKRIVLLLVGWLGICTAVLGGVDVRSERLTVAEGLANNSVRCIYQDGKGFIWFGTLDGLNRYDGLSFLTFLPEKEMKISLADHRVYRLAEDKNGFLWIRHTNSLYSCYDLRKGQVVDFTGCGEYLDSYSSIYIPEKADEDVWLWGTQDGCRRVVCKGGSLTSESFKKGKGLASDDVNQIYPDGKGGVWIATAHGLYHWLDGKLLTIDSRLNIRYIYRYEGKAYFFASDGSMYGTDAAGQIKQLDQLAVHKSLRFNGQVYYRDEWMIYTSAGNFCFNFRQGCYVKPNPMLDIRNVQIQQDNKHDFWIYNNSGKLRYLQVESGKVLEFQLMTKEDLDYIDEERYSIVHDSRGLLWIATYGNGLYVYDLQHDEMQHFTTGEKDNGVISSDYLLCLMEDRLGNMWVSSEFTGVDKLNIVNTDVARVYPNGEEKINRSNAVRFVSCLDGSDIYLATRTGDVVVYDTLLAVKNVLKANTNVYAIAEDREGTKWYGTRGKGIIVGEERYMHQRDDSTSLSSNQIYNLMCDSRGRMWVATFGGGLNLAVRKEGKYQFRRFFQSEAQNRVRILCEDRGGWIWMGTDKGIYVFQPDELIRNPNAYYHYALENGSLYSNEIRSIVLDSEGYVWIAETGAGFSYCAPGQDYARLKFVHCGVTDGLVNNMVQDFVEDLQGNMWISTEYGISCFDRQTGIFENHFFSSNVLGNIYCENCGIRLPDGRLAFGTNYGLSVINPILVSEAGNESVVTFTDLKLNGVSVRPGDDSSPLELALPYLSEIRLDYNQNSFVVNFSTLDYVRPGIQKFCYMLEGYEKEWSIPSPLNFAAYKNLRPGTYRLHVKASNSLGVWNEKESVLKIVVVPPFWRTIWAYLIYILLLGGALYLTYRILARMNALRNQIKVEEQLTEYKLVFFTNISHEFRTPLTLIQNALEKIHLSGKLPKEIASSVRVMDKSTMRLLRLINQLLEFRRMQNNKLTLSLEKIDVMDFLHDLTLNFKEMAESKRMKFCFEPSTDHYNMYVDKEKLDKVVYNLLSNAFKYTPSGGTIILTAKVDEAGNRFIVQVSDTGVGIPKEKREELFKRFAKNRISGSSMGIGLHLTHELVVVHKGTITYRENAGGKGSVFIVSLPSDASAYDEKDFLIPDNVILREEEKTEKQQTELFLENVSDASKEGCEEKDVEIPVPLNKRKVLIIEDDTDVREYLKRELSTYFEVDAEEDGISGLKKALEYDADLIISDVMMPGYSGFEVTRRLKDNFETSHIPVILLTALGTDDKHVEGIDCGADAYITKPFSLKLLLVRAFRLIEQRDKLRKKFSNDPTMLGSALCRTDKDKLFTERLTLIVEKHMENPQLSVDDLATMMGVGRSVFYRKVRGITGYSPNEYLRVMRMKKAADLLAQSDEFAIAEVARQVGINDPFYFSKCFKTQFGITPSAYQKSGGVLPGNGDADREENASK